jgi:hypothetical protein
MGELRNHYKVTLADTPWWSIDDRPGGAARVAQGFRDAVNRAVWR